jgi:squalene-hopene/tetraprenyl-beta-curcumene cyclase
MQGQDGGFGAFDVDNNALFLNKIPFSDMNAVCDPSWADVTGRVLEAFGMLLQSSHKEKIRDNLLPRIKLSSARAIEFLASTNQRCQNGSWYGRWGVNYIYGTCHVLCGLECFVKCPLGCTDGSCTGHLDHPTRLARSLIPPAIAFLKSCQNADGGWGECISTYSDPTLAGKGNSRAPQTAWALLGLLSHLPPSDEAIIRGVTWLVKEQVDMKEGGRSWEEDFFSGVGFPNFYYLGYDYYRHYFPMMALGRWARGMQMGRELVGR